MSECKADSSSTTKDEKEKKTLCQLEDFINQNDKPTMSSKGHSAMVFLKKGKGKRKQSRDNPHNISKELKENEKKTPLIGNSVSKKCDGLCFEEASNEFTCSSSITESYQLSTNKEARYCFRKLDDGTFAIEKKEDVSHEINEPITRKRSKKSGHQKGRNAHKPLKMCFKKRSKALRKTSDSKDDYKSEINNVKCTTQYDAKIMPETQNEYSQTGKKWATFKRLVTCRKECQSLKMQSQQQETNPDNVYIQRVHKVKRFSHLRIPCIKFSRGKNSSNNSTPAEDLFCAVVPIDSHGSELEYDCKKNDKALAIKYQLQRSLDAENGKIGNNTDQCVYEPSDEIQSLPKLKRVMNHLTKGTNKRYMQKPHKRSNKEVSIASSLERRENSNISGICIEGTNSNIDPRFFRSPLQDQELLCCTVKCSENILGAQHSTINTETVINDQTSVSEEPLDNYVKNRTALKSDPYEMLLITTAASLVKKVLQESVQQLEDEEFSSPHADN